MVLTFTDFEENFVRWSCLELSHSKCVRSVQVVRGTQYNSFSTYSFSSFFGTRRTPFFFPNIIREQFGATVIGKGS